VFFDAHASYGGKWDMTTKDMIDSYVKFEDGVETQKKLLQQKQHLQQQQQQQQQTQEQPQSTSA
jgi:hypothetical protein